MNYDRRRITGVRKEDIRVEVEDSRYLIIRTETATETVMETETETEDRLFRRKFRLPERVNVEGISASYEDGVLTVTVPRLVATYIPSRIEPIGAAQSGGEVVARAA